MKQKVFHPVKLLLRSIYFSVINARLGYGLDGRGIGVQLPAEETFRRALGLTQSPAQRVPGDVSSGAKRKKHESNHSFLSSA
jgi:hypothetical protein